MLSLQQSPKLRCCAVAEIPISVSQYGCRPGAVFEDTALLLTHGGAPLPCRHGHLPFPGHRQPRQEHCGGQCPGVHGAVLCHPDGWLCAGQGQHPPLDVRCTAASCNTCFEQRSSLQDRSYVLACAAVITCPPKHPCCSECDLSTAVATRNIASVEMVSLVQPRCLPPETSCA